VSVTEKYGQNSSDAGALNERHRLSAAEKEAKKQAAKKTREPNLVFPRTGKAWLQEDLELIHSIIDDIPDESIDDHVLWLSKQQGRTLYATALKIVNEGRMNEEWAKSVWKSAAKSIREDFSRLESSMSDNMPDNKVTGMLYAVGNDSRIESINTIILKKLMSHA
jgi:hypothetical protein